MYKRVFLPLFLPTLWTAMSASSACGGLPFLRHADLDDVLFTESLVAEHVVEGRFLCSERCYHHPFCNMLLYNPESQRCRLYKSFVNTGGTADMGWQCYAVDCNKFRLENAVSLSVVNQSVSVVCRSGFSYFPSPPLRCHLNTGVINIGMCVQTRWVNQPYPFRTVFPAPLSNGAEISVRWAGKGENVSSINLQSGDNSYVFHFAVRWWETEALYNTKSSAGQWETELFASTFIFTPDVVYNVSVRITTTHYLIFIDGDSFLEAPIRKPVEDAVSLVVYVSHLESVEVKYP
ncbi:uncharacterized protein LOC124269307 [Haliotis rubra]|uniref:uncharacterized protein LOC124269307 n=1 Tax=Haliotis rubra TaxID=36100 RepID=UPI001EE5103F|nr:uncharacterized protein LOC124269307 [Haliotis rubra]